MMEKKDVIVLSIPGAGIVVSNSAATMDGAPFKFTVKQVLRRN